jgi:hypothetical protein
MRFRYAISYEADTSPVETRRGELDARDTRQAVTRGGREAVSEATAVGQSRAVTPQVLVTCRDAAGSGPGGRGVKRSRAFTSRTASQSRVGGRDFR